MKIIAVQEKYFVCFLLSDDGRCWLGVLLWLLFVKKGQGFYEPSIVSRFGNPFDGSITLADDAFTGIVTADIIRSVF